VQPTRPTRLPIGGGRQCAIIDRVQYRAWSGRTIGYWAFYAVVGGLLLLMAMAGGGDLGSEDRNSPTRTRTKILAACSGAALGIAALGLYLSSDPRAAAPWPAVLLWTGACVGIVLAMWSCRSIAADLSARPAPRR
jgi:hypothetical protein